MESDSSELGVVELAHILLSRLREKSHHLSAEKLTKIDSLLSSAQTITRKAYNATRAINRLPDEILSLIFQRVPERIQRWREPGEEDPEPLLWATVTSTHHLTPILSVCTHWHNVAITTPSLWTTIHDASTMLRSKGTMSRAIKLSRALPLKVYIETWPGAHTMSLFQPENPEARIEELHLIDFLYDCSGNDSLLGLLNFPAQRLQRLTLRTISPDQQDLQPYARAEVFVGQNPPLRYLALHGIHWLPARGFSSLTHLQLRGQSAEEFNPVWTLPDLHGFLSHCTNLQEIIIADVSPPIDHVELVRCTALTLGHLRHLSVGRVAPGIAAWLISHLLNPTGLMVRILDMVCNNRGLLPMLARAVPGHAPTRVAMVEGPPRSVFFDSASDTSGLSIETTVGEDGRPCSDCFGWVASWWTIWDMSAITELWYHSAVPDWMRPDLGRWLSMLSSVRIVFIGEPASTVIEQVLRPWFRTLTTHLPNMRELPCPALATLVIWLDRSSAPPQIICELVETRARLGFPIKHLRVLSRKQSGFDKSVDWSPARNYLESLSFETMDMPPSMLFPAT